MATRRGEQVMKNTAFLYLRMLFLMIISLYTSRVVLKNLGIEDYGVYNVISGFITLFSLLKFSFASQRFVAYALGENNVKRVKNIICNFNALNLILIIIFLVLAEYIGIWYIKNKLVFPDGQTETVLWVYQTAIISFVILLYGGTYQAMIVAYERMNVFAYISIIEGVIKLVIAILISLNFDNKLKVYALLMAIGQMLCQGVYIFYCRCKLDAQIFRFAIDRRIIKDVLGFSAWISLSGIFVMLSTQGLNLLLNYFGGPVLNAARGLSIQIQTVIQNFGQNFMQAINPQIIKSWAERDTIYAKKLFVAGSKLGFLLMFCISLPVLVAPEIVMTLWLGEIVPYSIIFVRLILIWSLISILSYPCMMLKQATGDIRNYQLIEMAFLALVFFFSWLFLRSGNPPQSVFWVTLVGEIFLLSCRLWMVLPLVNLSCKVYIYEVFVRLLIVAVGSLLPVFYIAKMLAIGSFVKFIVLVILSVFICLTLSYLVGCSCVERRLIISFIKKYSNRWKK